MTNIRITICPSCGAAWPRFDRVALSDDDRIDDSIDDRERERWEGVEMAREAELGRRGDYPGLVRHLEQVLAAYPDDDDARLRLAEAAIRVGTPARAIALLTPLHQRHPDALDVQLVILDALSAAGRHEDDFPWLERMPVLRLDDETLDACARYLARISAPCPLNELYALGPPFGYLRFTPEAFGVALDLDPRFAIEPEGPRAPGPHVRLAYAALAAGEPSPDPLETEGGENARTE